MNTPDEAGNNSALLSLPELSHTDSVGSKGIMARLGIDLGAIHGVLEATNVLVAGSALVAGKESSTSSLRSGVKETELFNPWPIASLAPAAVASCIVASLLVAVSLVAVVATALATKGLAGFPRGLGFRRPRSTLCATFRNRWASVSISDELWLLAVVMEVGPESAVVAVGGPVDTITLAFEATPVDTTYDGAIDLPSVTPSDTPAECTPVDTCDASEDDRQELSRGNSCVAAPVDTVVVAAVYKLQDCTVDQPPGTPVDTVA